MRLTTNQHEPHEQENVVRKNIIFFVNALIVIVCQIVVAILTTFVAKAYDVRYLGYVTLLMCILMIVLAVQIKTLESFWLRLGLLILTLPIAYVGWFYIMRVYFGLLPKG